VLVSPNNPTGAVTPPSEIRKIADLAIKHDLVIVSDEIYAKIIYEGNEHLSIATIPGMKERTITLNGFSKTYAMTGWRIGYLAAPADFVGRITDTRHTLSINTCTISQYAALAAVTGPQEPILAMIDEYAARRAYLLPALDEMGLTYGNPGGAFYVYINVSGTGMSTPEFCEKLLRETGVMLFPGTMFGDHDPSYIRMSFLQPIDKIKDAVERMKGFIAKHAKVAA
jgi:aminotransferase